MVWNDKLSVGVEELDEDHKKLVDMINELYDAIMAGHGKEPLAHIIDQLVDYTRFHFAHEEKLFAMTSYQDAEAHMREHRAMEAWALKTRAEFTEGSLAAPSLAVVNQLKDWVFEHILGTDKKYSSYFNAMGIR